MIRLENIFKEYSTKHTSIQVLRGINMCINKGELISIIGKSGSGKTTLLNIIGLLDCFTSGSYLLSSKSLNNLSEVEVANIRNRKIGFVFQSSNLIVYKNIIENVALPLFYQGVSKKERNLRALIMLDKLGLKEWGTHFPNELSGGQKQRVAIARAMITNPEIILADEPTGQLDSETAFEVMNIFKEINKKGATVVIVTHEYTIAVQTNRIIEIKDGVVVIN